MEQLTTTTLRLSGIQNDFCIIVVVRPNRPPATSLQNQHCKERRSQNLHSAFPFLTTIPFTRIPRFTFGVLGSKSGHFGTPRT